MEETRNEYRILVGKPLGEVKLKDREGDGRIRLRLSYLRQPSYRSQR
jgi:hypothetical protein